MQDLCRQGCWGECPRLREVGNIPRKWGVSLPMYRTGTQALAELEILDDSFQPMLTKGRYAGALALGEQYMHRHPSSLNELDSLVALGILNRIKKPDWRTMFWRADAGQAVGTGSRGRGAESAV